VPNPDKPPLDLTRIEIRPFSDKTVVNRFSCGRTPLDRYIKNKAKKAASRNEHRVFCAHLDKSPNVLGYYSLQVGADSVSDLPDSNKNNYLKTYVAFPAINLVFLAVDESVKRQKLGQYLLMDVFERVAVISDYAGLFALTLTSLDDDSTAFYQSIGFTAYSENLKQPKMLYPLDDILSLVRGTGKHGGGDYAAMISNQRAPRPE
jgi:ribosomal protein S18 acetylase RimI-like enzyme